MRLHLGLIGLAMWLMASGLSACAVQTSISAEQLIISGTTATLPPKETATSTVLLVTRTPTPTRTPSPTRTSTRTPTARPSATEVPVQLDPAAGLTPIPNSPPVPDGVMRSADVPILMYHYISAAPNPQDRIRYSLSVPPEMFEAQLKLLRDNGFTTITLRDLYEYLAVGAPLPDKPIILTFDDGYVDNYTHAFPLLQKYGMTGTFFVLTGRADDGDPVYLSWDMIQQMSNAGMDIQLHSRDHLDMRNRSYDWLVFQIIGGRQSIEGHTGKPVIFMAYPSGKYDANALRFLRSTNFWAAVTTNPGSDHLLRDALTLDRVRIPGQMSLQGFARLLNLNITAQQAVPNPTAILKMTSTPLGAKPGKPQATPTNTIRPTLTAIVPRTAPPNLTLLPDQTPAGPPPPMPTYAQSPLITPTSAQSPIRTPMP